ncbi:hypothetical protein P167DRAFT_567834 [Morchella conica CCBAS932]|uniref:Uncharacterized protein n=1 Tax=Morchella conica CCBAS932 TaxID=1392247 RepID=A0A3N4KGZ2_9PEZI|nr:hypothetical protein P167DRAFT_567834 [Morchella conica CCBAS932]
MNGSSSKDLRLDSPPAQNPHCFPETHSPDIHDFGTGDSYPSAGKLPNLDFTPTNEGSLLGSIHTRIAALRTSSADTQNRHSQAANTLVPAEPDWGGMRTSTKNSLWNSTGFFAEGETASQLLRYRERHAEALASNCLDMAQDLIRRGQISIAAVRIIGHRTQNLYNNSVAHGCLARSSSEVSIWGWKPWREMAMAEKISERRRKRASMEREKIREKSVRRTRLYTKIDGETLSLRHLDIDSQNELYCDGSLGGAGLSLCSENVDYFDDRNTYISRSSIDQGSSKGTSSSKSSKSDLGNEGSTGISSPDLGNYLPGGEGPSTDGAREQETSPDVSKDQDVPVGWKWLPRTEPEIQWHLPVYNADGFALPRNDGGIGSIAPTVRSPSVAYGVIPTTSAVAYAGDSFLQVQTINEPSMIGLKLTPQISPKSVSPYVSSVSGNETYESSIPTASDISTSMSLDSPTSFNRILFERRRKPPGTDSNSDSTVGASRARNHLRKMKTAFKSIPLTKIHFPWSSSDEESGAGAVGLSGVQTDSTDSSFATGSEQSWPPANSIPPGFGRVPPPPPLREFMPYVEPSTPETRIHSPHPRLIDKSPPHPGMRIDSIDTSVSGFSTWRGMSITRHRESDPLTRTEKEYQELLALLNELKRELRMRRRRRGKKSNEDK